MTIDPENLIAHAGFIRNIASALLRDENLVEDVLQQTMLEAIERPPRDPSALRGWLRKVVVSFSLRSRRDEALRTRKLLRLQGDKLDPKEFEKDRTYPSPTDLLTKGDLIRSLGEAVANLREPYRSTVLLRYYEELSFTQISSHTDVPVKTVRTRLYRALDQIRTQLDSAHGDDRKAWSGGLGLLLGRPERGPSSNLDSDAHDRTLPDPSRDHARVDRSRTRSIRSKRLWLATTSALGLSIAFTLFRLLPIAQPALPSDAETLAIEATVTKQDKIPTENPPLEDRDEASRSSRDRNDEPLPQPRIPETGSLRVSFRWSDGTPAVGIRAQVVPANPKNGSLTFMAQNLNLLTGPEGTVVATGLAPGKVSLFVDRMQVHEVFDIEPSRVNDTSVQIPKGLNLDILVVDKDSNAIENADIVLSGGVRTIDSGISVGRTGPDGRYLLRDLCRQRDIGAKAPPFAPSLSFRVSASNIEGTLELKCVLPGPGGDLHGQVLDSEHRPVADAEVLLEDLRTKKGWQSKNDGIVILPPPFRTHTNEEGLFRIQGIQPRPMALLVTAPGRAPVLDRIEIQPSTVIEPQIVLPESVIVKGRVLSPTGQPIENALVSASDSAVCLFRGAAQATSDTEGYFLIESLTPGEIVVEIDGRRNRGRLSQRVQAVAGEVIQIDTPLSFGHQIRGRVVGEKGLPLPGYHVVALTPPEERPEKGDGSTSQETSWPGLQMVEDTTDQDGNFRIANRPLTPHRIEVFAPDPPSSFSVLVREEVTPGDGEIELSIPSETLPSSFLRGRFAFSDGSPFYPGVVECIGDCMPYRTTSIRTESDGSFRLGPFPSRAYRIRLALKGTDPEAIFFPDYKLGNRYSLDLKKPAAWNSPANFHALGKYALKPDQELDLGTVSIGLPGSLSARLQSEDGSPLGGIKVTILDRWKDNLLNCPFDGEWAVCEGLFPGRYYLFVGALSQSEVGSALHPFDIQAGEETSFSLSLKPGAFCPLIFVEPEGPKWSTLLALEIFDENGTPVSCFEAGRHLGSFTFGVSLPFGKHTVKARTDGGLSVEQRIRVRPGRARRPLLRLQLR